MKNFNFSLILTLYIFLIGWYFIRSKDEIQLFLVFAVAASPLLWLALYAQGRRLKGFNESRLKSNSMLAHTAALICSALLLLFIKAMGETKLGPVQFFGNFLVGWNYRSAAKLLALVIVLTASAATIWSGYGFGDIKKDIYRGKGPRIFFAGYPEIYRFLIYLYLVTFMWSLGFFAVLTIFKSTTHSDVIHFTIITSRAMLPLIALVPIAILRLRIMAPASLAAAGGVAYLIGHNFNVRVSAVFVGIPLAVAIVFLIVRYITVSAYVPAGAGVSPAGNAQPAAQAASAPDSTTAESKPEASGNE